MKKLFRNLAIVLALVLAVGVCPMMPAEAAELSLTKTSKTIFVDGCKGTKANGSKAKYYSYVNVAKLVKNFNSKTMDIKLTSADKTIAKTNNTKDRISAVAIGSTKVTVKVYNKSTKKVIFTDKINITVKKNATDASLTVSGIKNGDTFKVGDKVTVALARGTADTDARRLTCSDSKVTIKSAGTRKWTVTFTEAGTYTLLAEAYQSSTYKGATASKQIKVTVEADKTGTVKQTKANTIEVTGSFIKSGLSTSGVKIYSMEGNAVIPMYGVNSVSVKGSTATIGMLGAFKSGIEYNVEINGETVKFTACSTKEEDVAKMAILTTKALVNSTTTLEFAYFTAAGVDITSEVAGKINGKVDVTVTGNVDYAWASGNSLWVYDNAENKAINLEAKFLAKLDEKYDPVYVSCTGTVMAYKEAAPTATSSIYTLAKDDGIYMSKTDSQIKYVAKGETRVLEALFIYSDGKYKSFKDLGITQACLMSSDPRVCIITGVGSSGGFIVEPVGEGTATITVYENAERKTIIAQFPVEVRGARTAKTLTVSTNKQTLNINPAVGDALTVTAVVKDQYGDVIANPTLTITQSDSTKTATGIANFGAFYNSKLVINGTDIVMNPSPIADAIVATVKCGELSQTITFKVENVTFKESSLASYTIIPVVEGQAIIDASLVMGTQEVDSSYLYADIKQGSYSVSEQAGKPLSAAPTGALKASDLHCGVGETKLYCTLTFQNSTTPLTYITTSTNNIIFGSDNIEFKPVVYGSKLPAGTYTYTVYVIEAGATNSKINTRGSKSIKVVENESAITFTQLKDSTTNGSINALIAECFEFFFDGEKILPAYIASVDTMNYTNGGQAGILIKSVTFALPNTLYGTFAKTVEVNKSITLK